jgi:hypothetical protein
MAGRPRLAVRIGEYFVEGGTEGASGHWRERLAPQLLGASTRHRTNCQTWCSQGPAALHCSNNSTSAKKRASSARCGERCASQARAEDGARENVVRYDSSPSHTRLHPRQIRRGGTILGGRRVRVNTCVFCTASLLNIRIELRCWWVLVGVGGFCSGHQPVHRRELCRPMPLAVPHPRYPLHPRKHPRMAALLQQV